LWWLQDVARRKRGEGGRPPAAGRRGDERKSYVLGLAFGIVLFAALLSLSRGGIAALCIAASICAALCYWASSFSGRLLAMIGAAGLLIGVSLAIFGFDRVSSRLQDFSSGSLEQLDHYSASRRIIWAAAITAAPHHFLLGTGVGSFSQVYPLYVDAILDENQEYTHAENCYLQIMLETGFVGLALTLAGIVLCGAWCFCGLRSSVARRLRVCAAAIAASLAATVAHACVDFIWYVPACMAMVTILAACACRVKQLAGSESRRGSRESRSSAVFPTPSPLSSFLPLAITGGLAVVGGVMIVNRVGPAMAQPYWDEHLIVQNAWPPSPSPATPSADAEKYSQSIDRLENVVRWQPSHLPAHLALAGAHRQLFEILQREADNQMPLANIRDAAIQSHFASREALNAWLARAVGKHWVHLERSLYHTRKALRLCPLEGLGYVYLADLAFLSGADAKAKQTCVEQAVRVRPREGAVLYAAGSEALLAGDTARWLDYTKLAFRSGRRQQERLMRDLVGSTPRENLPVLIDFIIREFQPDLWDLRFLYEVCEKRCPPEQLRALVRCQAERAKKEAAALHGASAVPVWLEAQQLHGQLGDDAETLACARNAVECDSGNYDAHLQLASCLSRQRFFAEAESHWRWCQQRAPGDPFVEAQLREAVKGRLDNPSPATADGAHPINR
jgi:tetratricopeptide (TPR) repeat protein